MLAMDGLHAPGKVLASSTGRLTGVRFPKAGKPSKKTRGY